MKRNKTGFTLIELLVVIVILAIIALIAVPAILNIIDKVNIVAFKDSAYGVLNTAEYFYAASQLDLEGPMETVEMKTTDSRLELKGSVPTGKVIITRDGDISISVSNGRYCATKEFNDKDVTITEEFENCEIPIDGNTGSGEKTLTDLAVDNFSVSNVDGSNPTVVTKPTCLTDGTECTAGTPVAVKVNAKGDTFRFYVIEDKDDKVTLIMDRNLGDNVEWYADANNNSCGPTTALEQLKFLTNDWEIPEFTYTLNGLGEDNATQRYQDSEVTTKARLITYAEANAVLTANGGTMPNWLYVNLKNTGGNSTSGYWTSTASGSSSFSAWYVYFNGNISIINTNSGFYGLRPVIELSKSL